MQHDSRRLNTACLAAHNPSRQGPAAVSWQLTGPVRRDRSGRLSCTRAHMQDEKIHSGWGKLLLRFRPTWRGRLTSLPHETCLHRPSPRHSKLSENTRRDSNEEQQKQSHCAGLTLVLSRSQHQQTGQHQGQGCEHGECHIRGGRLGLASGGSLGVICRGGAAGQVRGV